MDEHELGSVDPDVAQQLGVLRGKSAAKAGHARIDAGALPTLLEFT
ncbi:hypothetical protein ACFYOK_38195 [Microbispora bryophytorum]